jgi:hypothetical protein
MSINESMTALANEVRRLSKKEDKLGIDGMTEALSRIDLSAKLKEVVSRTVTEITAEDLEGITNIGNRAFMNCDSLTKVTLPDTITNIAGGAFFGCDKLAEVNLPDTLLSIDSEAFSECVSLEEIMIPDSVKGIYSFAFSKCTSLKKVTWSAKAPTLYNGCFSGCTSLEYVDFSKCAKVAPLNSINVFSNVPSTCVFYVPEHLINGENGWRNASNWSACYYQIDAKSEVSGRWNITYNDNAFASFKVSFTYKGKNYSSMVADYDTNGDWCLYFDDELIAFRYGENIIVDFGTEPQLAPKSFTDFLTDSATEL